jgi:hypothetical protein
MKCERRDPDRAEAPLTIDQELQLGDQLGEPSWFDLNRLRHPEKEHPKPAGSVALDVSMLKEQRI